jgi:hypothetical protein
MFVTIFGIGTPRFCGPSEFERKALSPFHEYQDCSGPVHTMWTGRGQGGCYYVLSCQRSLSHSSPWILTLPTRTHMPCGVLSYGDGCTSVTTNTQASRAKAKQLDSNVQNNNNNNNSDSTSSNNSISLKAAAYQEFQRV